MCAQLDLARSSFYAWRTQVNHIGASATRREVLKVLIKEIYDEHRKTYGCRRITAELNVRGYRASVGLVAKLMREMRLAGIQTRAYKRTTIAGAEPVVIPDLLEGDFDPSGHVPGQALVGDITYLRTGQGWVYLATVIDLSTGDGGGLANGLPHAHIPSHRGVGDGHRPRQGRTERAVSRRSRKSIYVRGIPELLHREPHPSLSGAHRGVLGQCGGRELLCLVEKRDVSPPGVHDPGPCKVRGHGLYRGVLQPPTQTFQPRLSHPGTGLGRTRK